MYEAGELRRVGLALIPSGRPPHYDVSAGPIHARTDASGADELVDRFVGHLPSEASRLRVGGIAIAGRPGGYTWALIEEITDTAVYFRAIEPEEARKHGQLGLAAS